MITGDPALDAWLTAHSHFIAAAPLVMASAVMFLTGLAEALKEDQ